MANEPKKPLDYATPPPKRRHKVTWRAIAIVITGLMIGGAIFWIVHAAGELIIAIGGMAKH
jgi:hypothetical protein